MSTELVLCAWCLKYFEWTVPRSPSGVVVYRPRYCKKSHKAAANMASRRFMSHFPDGYCPTPDKRAFDDHLAANLWMATYPERSSGCRAYLCNCGKHHVGRVKRHIQSAEQLRLDAAYRAATAGVE